MGLSHLFLEKNMAHIQARTEFAAALNQLASEKGVDVGIILEAIVQAALAAYRKDLSLRGEEIPEDFDSYTAKIDSASGEISIFKGEENITPPGFARIAAQTAKQVIMQRLHEAEKDAITEEYEKKVGTVISGAIQRQEGNTYFIDIGRAEGVLPITEQTRDEYYHFGQRLKVYIKEIREGRHGPEVVVSRSTPELIKGLFAMEVPEISSGAVVIKDVAREAGIRTKLAAVSTQEGVDPVGSLVGQKGVRVQAVMNELGEERIDIISYSGDPAHYVAAALSPAKDVTVKIDEENKIAKVKVPTAQLSLAIGKGGQNVRLAAKLTGWKIDIEGFGTEEVKEGVSKAAGSKVAKVVEEAEDALEVGEQPIPTDESAKKEGKEAVVEGMADEVARAEEEESIVDSGSVEEPNSEEAAESVKAAEEDIQADDQGKEKEKLEKGLGSFEEDADKQRGDTLAMEQPSEEQAPTVVETVDMPEEKKMVESMEKAPKEDSDKKQES